jgi:hypothetical protein
MKDAAAAEQLFIQPRLCMRPEPTSIEMVPAGPGTRETAMKISRPFGDAERNNNGAS